MAALAKAGWGDDGANRPKASRRKPAGFRKAAAVLAYFDPARLKPLGAASPRGAFVDLAADILPYYDPGDFSNWTLRPEIRQATLKRVSRGQIDDALAANTPPDHPLQRMLTSFLVGNVPAITKMSLTDLELALQVSHWVSGGLPDTPRLESIRVRLDRARLLNQFEPLVEHFSGRTKELDDLRNFVECSTPAPTGRQSAARHGAHWPQAEGRTAKTRPKRRPAIIS